MQSTQGVGKRKHLVLKDHRYAGRESYGTGKHTDGKGSGGRVNISRIVLASICPARTGCTHVFCAVNKFKTLTSLPALVIIFCQDTKTHHAVRILLLPYANPPTSLTVRRRRWTVVFAGCNTNSSGRTCKFTWGDSSPLCFQSIQPTDNPLTQHTLRKIYQKPYVSATVIACTERNTECWHTTAQYSKTSQTSRWLHAQKK